jgi:peptidoglycan/LPS O-acetylase OafA/YrhL
LTPRADFAVAAPRQRLYGLQALRFLAALLVVLGHCQHEIVKALGERAGAFWTAVPFDWGVGVDIFFVISGFIMWHLMQDSFGKPGESLLFLRRRLSRIAPIYWLGTTIIALATLPAFEAARTVPFALASYAFVPWPHPDGRGLFPVLSLGWTLNYEMMFYCVFALALKFPRQLGIALIAAVFAGLFAAARLAPPGAFMLKFWGDPIIFEFLLGIGVAALHRRAGQWLAPAPAIAAALAGAALAIVFYQTDAYHHVHRLVTGGIPAVLIVAAVVCGPGLSTRSRWAKALVLGGDASYALYLAHPFALKAVAAVAAALGLWSVTPAIPVAAMILAAVAASVVIFRYMEKPVLTLLLKHAALPARRPG